MKRGKKKRKKKKRGEKSYHVTFEPFPPVIPTSFAELTRFNGRRMINDDPSDYHGRAEEDTAARTGRRTFLSSDFQGRWARVTGRAGLILSKIIGTHERFCESMPDRVPLYLPRDTMISQAAA